MLDPAVAVPALAGALLVALVWTAVLHRRLAHLRRQFARLAHGVNSGNLEQLLASHLTRIDRAEAVAQQLGGEVDRLARQLTGCLQRTGLVKYDAFGNVGGAVSFALALLDDQGHGVVLNSLYARDGSTIYAKPLAPGEVPSLTDEERQAVAAASSSAERG